MTNKERWDSFTDGLASPQNYIDWGWLYLVAASLQRRVWCPPDHRRCYPNMYVTLVGRPGIGKGQVIRSVSDILKMHKLEDVKPSSAKSAEEQMIVDSMAAADLKAAQDEMMSGKGKEASVDKPDLIPIAADAVTYEALVQSMSRCIRRINYSEYNPQMGKDTMKIYSHSSLCFCLEEIASLFRKNTESLVNFLIQAYDCGDSYEYQTKTAGRDRIRRLCLNFFGGTNPDFMQDTFDDKLLSQGYSSRTFYVFASKNRKSVFFLPELSELQKQHRKELAEHVVKLTRLYGQVKIDNDTWQWLHSWWEDYEANPEKRASKSLKLDAYYARKNIHVMKIAMAMHFGESLDLFIPRATFERAMEFLATEEKTMHLALTLDGKNPLADTSRKLCGYLAQAGKKNFVDLLVEFNGSVRKSELEEILETLQTTGQIVATQERDEHTNDSVMYYKMK